MDLLFSKALLNTVMEDTPDFMGVYNVNNHKFLYINKSGLELLHVADLEDFIAKYPHGFRKEKLTILQHFEIEKHLLTNDIWKEEVLFVNILEQQFWGGLQLSRFEIDGSPCYFVRIEDITDQKNNEQLIIDEENRFEALFMHAAIGIVMVNKDSQIVLTNIFADYLFGYEQGELINRKLEILIPDNVRKKHKYSYNTFTEAPQSRSMGLGLYLHGKKKDGSLFPVEISLSHFKSGDTPYYISFINDITFKKKAEDDLLIKNTEIKKFSESLEREVINRTNALVETLKSLEKSKADLEIALNKEKDLGELKSRFVVMASHEFRTPLTAIQSAASLIEKYPEKEDQEKRERHTSRIKSAVGNLTDILEEFLSVGKLEEGKVLPKKQAFDLPEMVDECLMDLRGLIKKGQNIEFTHLGRNLVNLDKSLFRKIIINLCSNALKFSPDNASIHVFTEITEFELKLKVADKGIGISIDDQKHLFDRFFRGTNVTHIQGTGLGLHIVAQYAELLNGKVDVESEINVGTTFTVTINIK